MGTTKRRRSKTPPSPPPQPKKPTLTQTPIIDDDDVKFVGAPVPDDVARSKWPHRYQSKSETTTITVISLDGTTEQKQLYQAKCHYEKAIVDGVEYNLLDDAFTQASDGPDYVGKIVEMFETVKKEPYIYMQWFYRPKDTVIKNQDDLINEKRVFFSDIQDDNHLSCITSKAKVVELALNMDTAEKEKLLESSDLYVDLKYTFPPAFAKYPASNTNPQTPSAEPGRKNVSDGAMSLPDAKRSEITVLDLYSGCGAMSSGLSIGALLAGENAVTKWAVDFNSYACESLKFNHPETEVRNEDAGDFLVLLKEWLNLCKEYNLVGSKEINVEPLVLDSDASEIDDGTAVSPGEYEVERLTAICYGDPNKDKKKGVYFKVCWKGYGPEHDTWEPIDGLSNCKDKIKEFVSNGYRSKVLPLPGDVDCVCGGPPCQGMSGFNRFRDGDDPLKDEKNRQLIIYMDIVEFLKPRYVLMENVTDILKFSKGQCASYAVGRLVSMNYQTRLGIMAAGAYGVPQCRMRFFLWGAGPMESLPQFPMPTHEIMKKGVVTNEYKELIVGQGDGNNDLFSPVLLGDAISDFPEVTNDSKLDEMPYGGTYKTPFQQFIRLNRHEIFGNTDAEGNDPDKSVLYDHRPYECNADDYERVCLIPKVKGANYRDLPGVIIGSDKRAKLDPSIERARCKSGKPLVPDYALKYESGKSTKPFGRLGMDDIVATVVTRPEPHNQVLLHLNQDRVLSVRENARLQGFPDCYKLFGPIKERYMQVGNAVSFSASIPLGYCLGKAIKGENSATPLTLPFKFPDCLGQVKSARQELEESIS